MKWELVKMNYIYIRNLLYNKIIMQSNYCYFSKKLFVFNCRIYCFLFFICFHNLSFGQTNRYIIQHYVSENGLPQNSVKSIQFDKDGYCWLATEAGLVRFDNNSFLSFGMDKIPGLRSERINLLWPDIEGNLYGENSSWQCLKIEPSLSSFAPKPVLSDDLSNFFPAVGYHTTDKYIDSLWNKLKATLKHPTLRQSFSLFNGDLYLEFDSILYYINKNEIKKTESPPALIGSVPLNHNIFIQVWKRNYINVWENGSLLSAPQSRHLEGAITTDKHFLSGDFKLLWCEGGAFIYAGNTLYKLEKEGSRIQANVLLDGIDIPSVSCVYYNQLLKTVYLGSLTQGLYVVKVPDFFYPKIPASSGYPNFYTIAKTSNEELVAKNVVIPRNENPYYAPFHNDYSVASYVDSENRMYYEKDFDLYRYDFRTKKDDKIISLDDRLRAVIPIGSMLLLCTHRSIYMLGQNDTVLMHNNFAASIKANDITSLTKDTFLLSTQTGLKWYDLKRNRFYHSILDSINIRSVKIDKSGRIWISSDGSGAFMYQDGHAYTLPLGPLKAFKTIHAFIEDGQGDFWLPTNNGLFRVPIARLVDYITGKDSKIYFYMFGGRDGLLTNEFNGGADPLYQWLSDSTLALPSMNGLVEFKPGKMTIDYPKNKIFIDELSLDSVNILPSVLSRDWKLSANFRQLNIKISCPYFGDLRNLQLEYSIHTDDGPDAWVPVNGAGLISVNTLPAGKYQVIVRKLGLDEKDKASEVLISFSVRPRFYNTWWFYCSLFLLFMIVSYIIAKRRIISLRRENERIEQLVSVRTSELNIAISELMLSEMALKKSNEIKEQIMAMILHDLRSPIRFIGTISRHIIGNFKKDNSDKLFNNLNDLNRSIGGLWGFIEQFFSWAVSQQDSFHVNNSTFGLQEVFDDVKLFYSEILCFNGNRIEADATGIMCTTDKQILSLILRNLVDNANKNTLNGLIVIRAYYEGEGSLCISVKDTGKGLSESERQMFMNASTDINTKGMGSVMILNMLKRINGSLFIQTTQGVGSDFMITLRDELD